MVWCLAMGSLGWIYMYIQVEFGKWEKKNEIYMFRKSKREALIPFKMKGFLRELLEGEKGPHLP